MIFIVNQITKKQKSPVAILKWNYWFKYFNAENIKGIGFWDTMGSRDDFVRVGNPRFKPWVELYGSDCLKIREAVERKHAPSHTR